MRGDSVYTMPQARDILLDVAHKIIAMCAMEGRPKWIFVGVLSPEEHIFIPAELGDVFLEALPIELAIYRRWWSFLSREGLRKGSPVFESSLLTKVICELTGDSPPVKFRGVVCFLRWSLLDSNPSEMIREEVKKSPVFDNPPNDIPLFRKNVSSASFCR